MSQAPKATWGPEPVRPGRAEVLGLLAILALAAVLRFVDLPTRGMWDADQGHDMLVLRSLVEDGVVPLLGPPTSIGDFHHGVLYYYLLAPAAALSGADPFAVVAAIALAGVAAVAVTWWLARAIAGPVAAFVAGGLMAVATSAIEESTFIWNPNLIALSSAVALAAAWRAWTTWRARWWVMAAAGLVVTMHLHVLGWALLVPLVTMLALDVRRRGRGPERRRVLRAAAAGCGLIAVSYLPLLVHELGSGFSETRAAFDFLVGGSRGDGPPLLVRLVVVPLRVVSWPLTGLITAAPVAAILAAVVVVAILGWRLRVARGRERVAVVLLAGTLAWSSLALAVAASSLATVVPGLPNDHYHAFLDPVVFVTIGIGAAALWRTAKVARVAVAAVLVALVALNVTLWPPREAPDGGYPAAERAASRVIDEVSGEAFALLGLPSLKNTDAYGFPLRRLGRAPVPLEADPARLVVACDRLLEPITGAPCGGVAEDQLLSTLVGGWTLEDRWDASSRTLVSIYTREASAR